MKSTIRILIFCIALCACNYVHAQYRDAPAPPQYSIVNKPGATLNQIVDTMYAHANLKDTAEGGELDQIKEFAKFWQTRVFANDKSGVNMFQQYYNALTTAASAKITKADAKGTSSIYGCSTGVYAGNWVSLGPDNFPMQVEGYVTCIWADPTTTGYVLAGTQGGLFKTTNDGATWDCITDNTVLAGPTLRITSICVDPTNSNNIYVGTAGADILESTDGGVTWSQESIVTTGEVIGKIYITPDGAQLYVFYNNAIYSRPTAGGPWINITSGIISGWFELQFDPSDQTHMFISGSGGNTGIWETKHPYDAYASAGWNMITSGFADYVAGTYTPATGWVAMDISLPGSDTLYFVGMNASTRMVALYKYNVIGSTHSITKIYDNLPYGPNPNAGHFKLIVSPGNHNNMYYASDIPAACYDRTHGFSWIGTYWSAPTHGDIRDIYLQSYSSAANGTGDRLYLGNDGGASEKKLGVDFVASGTAATTDISGTGLHCGTYWDFAMGDADAGLGGMMHDGVITYEPELPQPWNSVLLSDAWGCEVDKMNPTEGYSYGWYWEVDHTVSGGGRQMASLPYFATAPDPGYPGVGQTLAADAFGTVYNTGQTFSRKLITDPTFYDVSSLTGFPNTIGTANPYYGAAMAINPNNSDFEGYVLYNTNAAPYQHIWYRHSSWYGAASEVVGTASWTIPGASNHMNAITTDKDNTENVWVTLGGTITSSWFHTRYRVTYSPDHGTTWIDVSNGLPQLLPAGAIVYDEGANILYASTDMGMYRCDWSLYNPAGNYVNSDGYLENDGIQWTCFNQGAIPGKDFPNQAAGTLQINHCEGKLYAALWGRSVWATDINPPGTLPSPATVISSPTTWTTDHYIASGIDVLPGATLTISHCTVHMPKGGVLAVEAGAHLIVDGSVLTNDCSQCFWQGIQVRGNTFLPQYPANQGWATIENGSTIENALIGVANCNSAPTSFWGSTGGIIQASSSTFKNNQNDATFLVYDNWHGSSLFPNLSNFRYCTFLLDNNYKGNIMGTSYKMNNMVYLSGVEGINFISCNFLNRDTDPSNKGTGEGIHSHNSGFYVSPSCPPGTLCITPYIRSRFCGFTNGVYAEGVASWDPTISVDEADFDTTSVGVFISKALNSSTTRCNFKVGNGLGVVDVHSETFTGCYQNIGIFIQGSSQFNMEGNAFTGQPNWYIPNWYNFGTVIANTGANTNNVYRNTFGDSLTMGVFSVGDNRSSASPTVGLTATCNVFSKNADDIIEVNDGGAYPQGMAQYLGYVATPAGNTFTGSTHNIVSNTPFGMSYFYTTGSVPETPYDYSSGSGIVFIAGTTPANSCPSSFGPFAHYPVALGYAAVAAEKSVFVGNQTLYQNVLAQYNSLIDFGSTSSLVSTILNSSNPQSLFQTLSSGSPYISETALTAVGDNMKLPYGMMMPLLQQNPDNLRDMNFIARMQTDYQLSASDVATLRASAQNTTPRTQLESSMYQSQSAMAASANAIMMALKSPVDTAVDPQDTTGAGICTDPLSVYYLLDSNSYYPWLDTVDPWLQTIGGLWTDYARTNYYNWRYGPLAANNMFQSMANTIPQTPPIYMQEYTTNASVWNILGNAEMSGRDMYRLTPSEINALSQIGGSTYPYTANGGILSAYSLSHLWTSVIAWPMDPCLYFVSASSASLDHKSGTQANGINNFENPATAGFRISVYPNPGQNKVSVSIDRGTWGDNAAIEAHDITGRLIMKIVPDANESKVEMNTSSWIPGVYMIEVQQSNGSKTTERLIIEKE